MRISKGVLRISSVEDEGVWAEEECIGAGGEIRPILKRKRQKYSFLSKITV
jgi:hypothetical protein